MTDNRPWVKQDSDHWAYLTGYVAQFVVEGSKDARAIYDYMCELKPSTAMWGDVYIEDPLFPPER
jgi:hypothetical protein